MGSFKATRYPDNELDASIHPIKELSHDIFAGESFQTSDGWNIMRMVEIGYVDDLGGRSFTCEKEWGFRPKFAGIVIDQVNYRHFDELGASEGSSPMMGLDPRLLGFQGSGGATIEGPAPSETVPEEDASWDVPSETVGWEMSMVSDFYDPHKGLAGWKPSSTDGKNRSTLVISRRPLEEEDKNFDFPRRYFGRLNDIIVSQSTQDVTLKRKRFRGGGGTSGYISGAAFTDDSLAGGNTGPQGQVGEDAEGSYGATDGSIEEYRDGLWKACLNVTAFDKPLERFLRQRNEHDGGPGEEGYSAHFYIPGYFKSEGGMQGEDEPSTDNYFQGGWMYDGTLDFLGQMNDIIGLDARKCEDAELPRWRNRFNQPVGISYLRHDAHFQKYGDSKCVPVGKRMSGRIFFTKPVQCPNLDSTPTTGTGGTQTLGGAKANQNQAKLEGTPVCGEMVLDVNLKNFDTRIGHECGEWRPLFNSPGGGAPTITSFSWHHNPAGYSGSGGGTTGAPAPVPTKQDGTKVPAGATRPPIPAPPKVWSDKEMAYVDEVGHYEWDPTAKGTGSTANPAGDWIWNPEPENP